MRDEAFQGRVDVHVHSAFSDDARSSVADNVASAVRVGLDTLVFADHVRTGTHWVGDLVREVRDHRQPDGPMLLIGVETKMLDCAGTLDIPPGLNALDGLDVVLVADHQLPSPGGPVHPVAAAEAIESDRLRPEEAVEQLVEATAAGLRTAAGLGVRPVVSHLFSVLPKIGLDEQDVPDMLVADLAAVACEVGALVDVNEKWSCPSAWVIARFLAAGVPVATGSDSHQATSVGVCPHADRRIAEARALLLA